MKKRIVWKDVGDGAYGYGDVGPPALYVITPEGARGYRAMRILYTPRGKVKGHKALHEGALSEAHARSAAERDYAVLREAVLREARR